uniref:ABC transmembrane type-2 domain-containing protein n=1 Tax=Pleurostichidium falkenbergii TaxID=121064 RepID=A0A4D6UYX8_9FLOR|nr:hypothetical protein [Pleurostichidium falkenbergii]QCH39724.1 hypothetical protein [Pleurostichidium falkenbergii]
MNLSDQYEVKKKNSFVPKKQIKLHLNKYKTLNETKAIIKRLSLQSYRRPANLMISMIQPILWLTLFGALFHNAPIYLFEQYKIQYREFLNPGIIIFTSFNGAINAGLSIIFDREFGFLNRILVSPISNKSSVIYSCLIHTWLVATLQIITIIFFTTYKSNNDIVFNIQQLIVSISVSTIIISNVSVISICSALILPGHIEFIALTTLLINLPTLFTSTALAPLSFMPTWLQVTCCINPLTYAIEIIRSYSLNKSLALESEIIKTTLVNINVQQSILMLITINVISIVFAEKVIKYKYD